MRSEFSAVLLAGGKSTRMGRDKAFIEIDGVPLWQRQLRMLEQVAPTEIFLAAPPRPEWDDTRWTIIPDAMENVGPLGALVTALRRCSTPLLLALPIDLPEMTATYLLELVKACKNGTGIISVTDRFEPLVAIYPAASCQIAEQLLVTGPYSLQVLAQSCLSRKLLAERRVLPHELPLFRNLNTPTDLVQR